jgi:hypothetical protein
LTWHNIFLEGEVNVTAFIDWDGVNINPASLGLCSYPSWLTHDWDPVNYGYEDDGATSKDTVEESSPAEFSRFHQHYSNVFEGLALPRDDPRETRLSHTVETIEIATGSQFNRDWIVFKVLVHAFHGKISFDYRTFAKEYMSRECEETVEKTRLLSRICGSQSGKPMRASKRYYTDAPPHTGMPWLVGMIRGVCIYYNLGQIGLAGPYHQLSTSQCSRSSRRVPDKNASPLNLTQGVFILI